MSVGKRYSTDQPLTEHDVAERLDKAALRVYRILSETRALGMADAVLSSRYHTNIANALAAELAEWGIEPVPLRESGPGAAPAVTRSPAAVEGAPPP